MLSAVIIRLHDRIRRRPVARKILVLSFVVTMVISRTFNYFMLRRNCYQTQFDLKWWLRNQVRACDGNFVGYANEFIWLKGSHYDHQEDSFVVPCQTEIPKYWFYRGVEGTPYTQRLSRLQTTNYQQGSIHGGSDRVINEQVTFAVQRIEAHNLYHVMCELFNIFLLMKLFGLHKSEIAILFLDSRPTNMIDMLWTDLYGTVLRFDQVPSDTVYKDLIWIPIGYESPLHFHGLVKLPYIDEFRELFMHSFSVNKTKDFDCNRLRVTVILRHDYASHPERMELLQGKVQRKFANEEAVLHQIQTSIGRKHSVRGVVLENLSMKDQLELISQTDVLIGIHGAGMTHILNLPEHAAVLEIRPYFLDIPVAWTYLFQHFRALARWRGLHFFSFTTNHPDDSIFDFEINVSLPELSWHVHKIRDSLCCMTI